MPTILSAFASGALFGLGLLVSQMVNPAKVIGFLDVFGDWDPSLAFVMATAIPVTALGYAFARRRRSPLCAPHYLAPNQTHIDRPLVIGAILFGVGWGLVGYCPGPALAALTIGGRGTFLFVIAMLIGMGAFRGLSKRPSRRVIRPREA
jgi:uncharacterized membrane protein YedE/YeeE